MADDNNFEEMIKKLAGLTNKDINSITIKQTAKGDFYADVKIYFPVGNRDAENSAILQIVDIYEKLSHYGIQALKK